MLRDFPLLRNANHKKHSFLYLKIKYHTKNVAITQLHEEDKRMSVHEHTNTFDKELFKELAQLHNEIATKRKKENEFDELILSNKERAQHPNFLFLFAERVKSSSDYFSQHEEMCHFFYDIMKTNEQVKDMYFGLRAGIRLGMFEDLFEDYLSSRA